MQQDDVARVDRIGQFECVGRERLFVDASRLVVERSAVPDRAVESVVDPFGDCEELGSSRDDEPPSVDPGSACVRDEGAEHLGDTAAACRRIDVVDDAALQQCRRAFRGGDERRVRVRRKDLGEALDL